MKKKIYQVLPFILVLIVWFASPVFIPFILNMLSIPIEQSGSFELKFQEIYDALNGLFSGLAFAGIIISISLQSKELSETREELKGQKNQLRRQVFENTFFQILRTLNEVIDTTYYKTSVNNGTEHQGRECIHFLRKKLKETYFINNDKGRTYVDKYTSFYNEMGHRSLSHYFKTLKSAIDYVNKSKFLDEEDGFPERIFYMNLIKAQLSSDELFLIFYHSLSEHGKHDFKAIIEEFSFLEAIHDVKSYVDHWVNQYQPCAFGNNEIWKARLDNFKEKEAKKTQSCYENA